MIRSLSRTLLLSALSAMVLCAADPMTGTWKLNPAKSKYSPGPAPKSLTVTIEQDGDTFKQTATGEDGEGKPINEKVSRKLDGKDEPYTGRLYGADTASVKRVDANTTESTFKKGGKLLVTSRSAVSKDGKTRTVTVKGVNAKGEKVNNVVVYDKQ